MSLFWVHDALGVHHLHACMRNMCGGCGIEWTDSSGRLQSLPTHTPPQH